MQTNDHNQVIRIERQGPPAVLELTTALVANPKGSEVLIKQEAIGLNFVDVLFRNGSFPLSAFPAVIGVEAAGFIEAVGNDVKDFSVGDRVAYYFSLGAYAKRRLVNASDLIKIPDDVSFDQAASLMAKGLTARMLVKQAYSVKPGDVILVHAAAGGVGSLVSRWAKALGATVIGTVGHASKKSIAINNGVDYVIALDNDNLESVVQSITNHKGVSAVYDGVGKATFSSSVNLLENGGTFVLYGTASGTPQIDAAALHERGIKLIRPSLGNYLPDNNSVNLAAGELFQALLDGIFGEVKPTIYPLAQAAKAHQDLESAQTSGSIIFHI